MNLLSKDARSCLAPRLVLLAMEMAPELVATKGLQDDIPAWAWRLHGLVLSLRGQSADPRVDHCGDLAMESWLEGWALGDRIVTLLQAVAPLAWQEITRLLQGLNLDDEPAAPAAPQGGTGRG